MKTRWMTGVDDVTILDSSEARVLSPSEERDLLADLSSCKRKLADALAGVGGPGAIPGGDDPQALAHSIASSYAGDGPAEARLGAVFRRYSTLRSRLALANMRLVAHVAKRFRDRGIAHADLIQEGFCGLLEAIDRFDLAHGTKLATYATWWIRQAMQRAVASGAYPVRLSPRHLRELARNQDRLATADGESTEVIHRIHTATRPTVSLDATLDAETSFTLIETVSAPEGDRSDARDRDEALDRLLQSLRPRERRVVSLRFGLGGESRLSLSQVGGVLGVSKERVRQIQDRALEKLRAAADEQHLADLIAAGG